MVDLNNLCLLVIAEEPGAIRELLGYYKIKTIIGSAVNKVLQKNPEYD